MKILSRLSFLIGLAVAAHVSSAALINAPVPTNAYITHNNLDWAWANPLPGTGDWTYQVDLTYQSQFGWRLPTLAELAFAPLATQFLFAGANVPFGGSDPISGAVFSATNAAYTNARSAGAVATPYFSSVFLHADWFNGLGQASIPWAGMAGARDFSDQLLVRDSGNKVPETSATIALFAAAFGAMAFFRRRFSR